jgi:hypothetical protein
MPRLMFSALLLTSCAAEVQPRADAGDPRVLPVGATAALDGSFSEGDGLTYAWAVTPADGATLVEPESPFATLIAEAPGFYILSLEVCDAAGRCDVAETWARVDAPGSASRISSWGIEEFGGAESGVGLPGGLSDWEPDEDWCEECRRLVRSGATTWNEFCNSIPEDESKERNLCRAGNNKSAIYRDNFCSARCSD